MTRAAGIAEYVPGTTYFIFYNNIIRLKNRWRLWPEKTKQIPITRNENIPGYRNQKAYRIKTG